MRGPHSSSSEKLQLVLDLPLLQGALDVSHGACWPAWGIGAHCCSFWVCRRQQMPAGGKHLTHLEGLLKHRFLDLNPRASDSASVGWGLGCCLFQMLPVGSDAASTSSYPRPTKPSTTFQIFAAWSVVLSPTAAAAPGELVGGTKSAPPPASGPNLNFNKKPGDSLAHSNSQGSGATLSMSTFCDAENVLHLHRPML